MQAALCGPASWSEAELAVAGEVALKSIAESLKTIKLFDLRKHAQTAGRAVVWTVDDVDVTGFRNNLGLVMYYSKETHASMNQDTYRNLPFRASISQLKETGRRRFLEM